MADPFLIVDGYNLMHAAGMARLRYGPGDLQRCRTQFLRYLVRHLPSRVRGRTTVVFDAGDAPAGLPRRTTLNGMHVLFADPGHDADTLIEQLIAAHSSPRQIRLVSSDHRLQKAARRRRGRFVDSEDFVAELEQRGPVSENQSAQAPGHRRAADSKAGGKIDPEETAEWLEIFGNIPETDRSQHIPETDPLQDDVDRWQSRVDELKDEPDDQPANPREHLKKPPRRRVDN